MGGRKESGKSQIHATKGGVHIVVLYGIEASNRQYTRILLGGTKTDTNLVIGYALYITFKHHLVGNVVGIRIPFVKNHRITLAEIGQNPLLPGSNHLLRSEGQIRFMRICRMILANSQIVQNFTCLTFLSQCGKPEGGSAGTSFIIHISRFGGIEFLGYKIIERIKIALFQRRKRTDALRYGIDGRVKETFPQGIVQTALVQGVRMNVFQALCRILRAVP